MNNVGMIFQLLKNSSNPQQAAMNMMKNSNNPIMQNVADMANSNNAKGIEQVARNLCREKGINPDDMLKNIKSQFGL